MTFCPTPLSARCPSTSLRASQRLSLPNVLSLSKRQAALQIQRSADVLPCRDFDGEGESGFSLLCARGGLIDNLDHFAIPLYDHVSSTSYIFHNITRRSHPQFLLRTFADFRAIQRFGYVFDLLVS